MKTQLGIVAIGNSRGVRLPKAALQALGAGDMVECETANGAIALRRPAARGVRADWAAALDRLEARAVDDAEFADRVAALMDAIPPAR